MNAFVIGANEDSIEAMKIARKYGYVIHAVDGNPEAKGLAAADFSYVIDISDPQKVFEVTDRIRPDIVLPAPIGHCLTTVGAVNDRYGLPGVSEKSALLCTDKYLFNELLEKKGVRKGNTRLIKKGRTLGTIPDEIRVYPLIVKPKTGSGSRGIEIISSKEELLRWGNEMGVFAEDYTLERFAAGEEYGIDGAFVDGRFYLILLRKKINTPPPYRQCVGYISVRPTEDRIFYDKCVTCMETIGRELGFVNCLAHVDVIREEGDEPFVIETSARPSGHNLSNYFTPMVTGVNMVEEFIKRAQKLPFSFVPDGTEKMMIRFFDLPAGIVEEVPDEKQVCEMRGICDYSCRISVGERLAVVTDGASVMGRGYYLIKAESEEELLKTDAKVRSGFRIREE